MHTTSASLLEQLRQPADQVTTRYAWERFVSLYTPLIYHWARRLGLSPHDAPDLVQDVFVGLVQKLPDFTYDPHQRFRGWLWTVTLNQWRANRRSHRASPQVENSSQVPDRAGADDIAAFDEREYQEHLAGRALQLMRAEFQPTTWRAFWDHVVSGRPAAEVAARLGVGVGAVYVAKCRVLRRLRQELNGLMD
jgi:RNA polymerase sigma-70 factor (ECF subfamily)